MHVEITTFAHPAVVGAGSWGSALALCLAYGERPVTLWGRNPDSMAEIASTRANKPYLPGITLPPSLTPTADWQALLESDLLVLVVPSQTMRSVAEELSKLSLPSTTPLLSCTKGLENETGLRMSEILREIFPSNPIAVLSGPNHAEEICQRKPAATAIGSTDAALAQALQERFTLPWLRTYTVEDIAGMEYGGALKNIFAIAAGIATGLDLGDNAKSALVTRGLAELIRLGTVLGGKPETFQGLSGIGDLIATCFSPHSRNHRFGLLLGQGKSVEEIKAGMTMVAEGVPNTLSAYQSARKHAVRTPIIDEMHAILYEGKPPQRALQELLSRDPRAEMS